jgi:hypothetical protein
MSEKKLHIIGDLINNAYARARNAFAERNVNGYQHLAQLQDNLGVDFLDLNIDATRLVHVKLADMLSFLCPSVPAI